MSELWIQPTGAALAADVHGVDLSSAMSDTTFGRIAEAWAQHLVLRFSGQKLDDRMLMAFSARFGELDRAPISAASLDRADSDLVTDARDWVAVISSVTEGRQGGRQSRAATNSSGTPTCPTTRCRRARHCSTRSRCHPMAAIPAFSTCTRLMRSLPDDLKRAVDGRIRIHDSSRNSAGELRRGFQRTLDVRQTPGAVHPLVRLHPVTKRKALFLGRRPGAYIHGLPVEESEALLDAVWAHATQERFAWYQKWRAGDLVLWDNRCVMHRRDAFDESSRRLMHRTQIVGEAVLAG